MPSFRATLRPTARSLKLAIWRRMRELPGELCDARSTMTFPSQLPDCTAYTWPQADAPVIKSIREEINLPTHVCRKCAVRLSSLNNQQQWRAPSHRSLAPVGGCKWILFAIGWESGRNGYKWISALTRSGTSITPETPEAHRRDRDRDSH